MTLSPDSPKANPSISPPLPQNSIIFTILIFAIIFPPELDEKFIKNKVGIICLQFLLIPSGTHA